MIVLVLLEVPGEVGDALGQQRDLSLGEPVSVCSSPYSATDDLLLLSSQRHGDTLFFSPA